MSTLKVGTIQDHANSNTAMTIDSSGRVTNPNIPFIFADCSNGSSGGYDTLANLASINFRNTISSRGGMTLNSSSFYITIPVTGIYQVNCAVMNQTSTTMEFGLFNSSVNTYQARWIDVTTRYINLQQAMPFSANDQISFRNTVGGNLAIHRNTGQTDRYTMVSMFLIG